MRVADLFAGIGGFHLGFNEAGGTTVFACESDAQARATYEQNFAAHAPDLFRGGRFASDIADVKAIDMPAYDVLTAGFPCQPFSYAGKSGGFMDRRGVLFYHLARLIMETRPEAFVFENVPGLRSHQHGITYAAIRETMTTQLGYSFHTAVLKACDYGVPQLRPRLFMVGFRDPSTPFAWPEPVPLRMTLSDVLHGDCDRQVSRTVLASGYDKRSGQKFNWDGYIVDGRHHNLTVDEVRSLQGFPDDFILPRLRSAAMRQLGNAVAVPVAAAVAGQVAVSLGVHATTEKRP
jgi:DNA (cytosine-5)-methyltransferase 1